ncbi:hypothetical protein ABPG77_009413 [Micractinium sp. CCAP 211/92]
MARDKQETMRPSVAGTPGGCAGTPGGSRTPARSRSNLAGAAARPRLPARAPGGIHSEPCSPRTAADASLANSCDGLEADLPALSPYDDTCSTGGPNAGTSPADAIRVFVRVRPLSERELAAGGTAARACVSVAQERAVVLADPARAGQEPFVASFDRVFGPEAGQGEVYAAVGAQMVHNCMAGFNSSIFVYGQTGAGKTHTITGDVSRADDGALAEECGLTLRVFRQLFDRITEEERDGVRYTVKCCYAEIYNEEITDLLNPGGSGLAIRDGDAHRGVFVEHLSEHVAVNADDVMRLIQKGSANRHTAATRMNERSSRSHSVFTAVVEAHERQPDSGVTNVRFAKLNLIDLAGSERVGRSGATGDQLTEARSINKSLTTLGRVVTALTEGKSHVPYRDSRLTFLLKESLGGNSKTSLVACVSPSEESVQETFGTLVFAAGAKKIRNRAVVNQDTVGDVRALQLENARLQRELAKREDVLAAELRQQLTLAQAAAAASEQRMAAAEERSQQLEVALNESHATLQQRNAEYALVNKEVEETKATCQLLQKDREQLIDHNAALAERVEQLSGCLERSEQSLQRLQQDLVAAAQRCTAAAAGQQAAEEQNRGLQAELERAGAELAQAKTAAEEGERREKALRREVEQLLSDLRRQQREAADLQELAAAREARLRHELAQLSELASARAAQLQEAEGKLAAETVATTKYRRMVGEIGKLIDWAQSTSPLPPTLGGRLSPAGYSSLMGHGRLSFGGGERAPAATPISPLGDASNQVRPSLGSRAGPSPKPQVHVASPSGRSPAPSPGKVR